MVFAKAGIPWVLGASLIAMGSYFLFPKDLRGIGLAFFLLTIPLIILTLFIVYFFRDPNRLPEVQYKPGISVLSPADGSICAIEQEGNDTAIYVEMHVTNVHVTRAHMGGTVKKVSRLSGHHYPIYFLKKRVGAESEAIRKNARVVIEFEDDLGNPFIYHLVCGKLARRARPYVKPGQKITEGERVGVICFGSLVKITMPGTKYKMIAKIGQNVLGGRTIICERILE